MILQPYWKHPTSSGERSSLSFLKKGHLKIFLSITNPLSLSGFCSWAENKIHCSGLLNMFHINSRAHKYILLKLGSFEQKRNFSYWFGESLNLIAVLCQFNDLFFITVYKQIKSYYLTIPKAVVINLFHLFSSVK